MRVPTIALLSLVALAACATPESPRSPSRVTTSEAPRSRSPSSEAALDRVATLHSAGRYEDVLELVARELPRTRQASDRARLELARGLASVADGRTQSGILAYRRALAELPERQGSLSRELLAAWGDAEMRLGDHREAARRYREALETGPQGRRETERLLYSTYLAERAAGDPAAGATRGRILLFSEARLSSVEREILGRPMAPAAPSGVVPTPVRHFPVDDPRSLLASIRPRGEWGAAPIRGSYDPMLPVDHVTIHHSAMTTSVGSSSDVAAELRRLQASHQEKWADLGYHFLIDARGGIWEGRDLAWQGAHEGAGLNQGALGVCLLGNFQGRPVPPAQLSALEELLEACRLRWGLTSSDFKTHKEVRRSPTDCPGTYLQGWVEAYRARLPGSSLARQ
jgi:tetratricopeptide (TPR) repeat protein